MNLFNYTIKNDKFLKLFVNVMNTETEQTQR